MTKRAAQTAQPSNERSNNGQSYELRRIVEAEVEIDRWDGAVGYLRQCPAAHLHNNPGSGTPIVTLGRHGPYAQCFHQSCRPVIAELNQRLYEAFVDFCDGHDIKIELTPEEKAERAFRKHLRVIRTDARLRYAPTILGDGVPVEDWPKESPYKLDGWPVKAHWALYIAGLFEPDDLLWIGDLYQSGRDYKHCFRTMAEWINEMDISPGPQVCAAPFKRSGLYTDQFGQNRLEDGIEARPIEVGDDPERAAHGLINAYHPFKGAKHLMGFYRVEGDYRRAKEFIRTQPYIVVESDVLDKARFGSIVRYFQKYTTLRALTDTGNKSIHALFDRPDLPDIKLRELYAIAEGLGCDPKMFRACVTTRLPGCKRLDADFNVLGWQRLLYLNPKFDV